MSLAWHDLKYRTIENVRNEGVVGSNPSCGTNKFNKLEATSDIQLLSADPEWTQRNNFGRDS
jgi:hypothetical protein